MGVFRTAGLSVDHMSQSVHHNPILICNFVHVCNLVRANPVSGPDSVMSHPGIVVAISDADEFHWCVPGSIDTV